MSKSKSTEIRLDRRNYRKHGEENKRIIKKSLEELGAGRSIVIDAEGEIIAGNGVFEQAQELGIKTKIVETDGSELVVVKRTDLRTQDEKRKKLAVADNVASDLSDFDDDLLREDWTQEALAEFGVEPPDLGLDPKDFGNTEQKHPTNSELDVDEFEDKVKMTLAFTIEEHAFVQQKLNGIGGEKEQALLKLLGYE